MWLHRRPPRGTTWCVLFCLGLQMHPGSLVRIVSEPCCPVLMGLGVPLWLTAAASLNARMLSCADASAPRHAGLPARHSQPVRAPRALHHLHHPRHQQDAGRLAAARCVCCSPPCLASWSSAQSCSCHPAPLSMPNSMHPCQAAWLPTQTTTLKRASLCLPCTPA